MDIIVPVTVQGSIPLNTSPGMKQVMHRLMIPLTLGGGGGPFTHLAGWSSSMGFSSLEEMFSTEGELAEPLLSRSLLS